MTMGMSQGNHKSSNTELYTYKVLFTSLVLDLLGFTLILPLIPSLLDHYSRHDQVCCVPYILLYFNWESQKGLGSRLPRFVSKTDSFFCDSQSFRVLRVRSFVSLFLVSWSSCLSLSLSLDCEFCNVELFSFFRFTRVVFTPT